MSRFFHECPRRRYLPLHHEAAVWDLHNLLYTATAASELEVIRLIDWIVDLPVPGPSVQPMRRGIEGLRHSYHRLPNWLLLRRLGELIDAAQLPELSLGDATATYTVATGGTTGPGSGMIIRVYKLIDWTQHVVGDLNHLAGWMVVRPQGLITWGMPGFMVDGTQWLLLKTFNTTSLLLTRSLDATLMGVELVGESLVNIGYRPPHEADTVFLRIPMSVYRAHELWFLEHQQRLAVLQPEQLAEETHASLMHRRGGRSLPAWSATDRPGEEVAVLVVVAPRRLLARAPQPLREYVVPSAWVLDRRSSTGDSSHFR